MSSYEEKEDEYMMALLGQFIDDVEKKNEFRLVTKSITCPKCGYPGMMKIAFASGDTCECGWVDKEVKAKREAYASLMNGIAEDIKAGETEITVDAKLLWSLLKELNAYKL